MAPRVVELVIIIYAATCNTVNVLTKALKLHDDKMSLELNTKLSQL